ncbi:LPS assembly protein LptD [Albimonas sp. CAU 1670]|uniref:LPS-assembly protein LptD n=1 Tax=Albimonas sp. CAU 1670 TaxID=3032599 RepID=UPI0023DAA79A|nr:LPS assembly protein LptD [Albimonas sp. CAU 1670]MDF2232626.1 LPS assembly protein LptD [Albimonas sp. CAU 1670]
MPSRDTLSDRPAPRARRRSARKARGALLAATLLPPALALAAPAGPAQAQGSLSEMVAAQPNQGPVSLVADRVEYDNAANTLTAEGNVEVYYGERTLTASRIVYMREFDRLTADGPIVLRGPEGATILASTAELDTQLRNGIIQGAQAVMQENLKFAANEGRRIDGRYNVLTRAVFSPCLVCPEDPTPLWRIRASRIVHDEEARTVHYEDATFDVLGVPVAWTPYFRHPDPTLERASGLLPPEYLQNSNFGYALKVPYYWVIDEQTDATITPYAMTDDGLIVEGEFRRAFQRGSLALQGSVTQQDYDGSDDWRGHIFGQGLYRLTELDGGGIEAGFSLQQASDDGYLRRYEFTNDDRLESEAFVRGSDAKGWGEVSLVRFQSLRDNEPFGQIPMALPVFEGRRVWDGPMGTQLGMSLSGYALKRTDGQDTVHGFGRVDVERQWLTDSGVQLTAFGAIRGDVWRLNDEAPGVPDEEQRLAPLAALDARYPLIRRDEGGDLLSPLLGPGAATHVLEPIVQGVAAPYFSDVPPFPDEDSQVVEFDETSLFDVRRHAGYDGFEEGPRLNVGLRYARVGDDGSRLAAAAGRVFRPKEIGSFPQGVGLNKRESDWVGAWALEIPDLVKLAHRVRVGDDLDLNRNEVYGSLDFGRLELAGSYVWLAQDAVTTIDRHEVAAEARLAVSRNWYVGGELQRDLQNERWVETEALVGYANECVDVAFYVGRHFTSTVDVPASTYFGARVNLWALGGAGAPGPKAGACAPVFDTAGPLSGGVK